MKYAGFSFFKFWLFLVNLRSKILEILSLFLNVQEY